MDAFWLSAALSLIGAYLLGAFPTAVVMAKIMRLPDPRTFGSGNPGATNMLRSGGKNAKWAAIITLIGDSAKGALAVYLAIVFDGVSAFALLGAVLGHCYSFFLSFKGGKGVATAIGALAVFYPLLAGAVLILFGAVLWASRMVSLSSSLAAVCAPFFLAFAPILKIGPAGSWWQTACLAVLSLLIILRHRLNLARVWAGKESRLGEKKD